MDDDILTPKEPRWPEEYPTRKKVKMFSLGALLGFLWGAVYFKQ